MWVKGPGLQWSSAKKHGGQRKKKYFLLKKKCSQIAWWLNEPLKFVYCFEKRLFQDYLQHFNKIHACIDQ